MPDDLIKSISITPKHLDEYERSRIFKFRNSIYPEMEDIRILAKEFVMAVHDFAHGVIDMGNEKNVDDAEIDRVQQLFDLFGQVDADFPPRMVAEKLGDASGRPYAVEPSLFGPLSRTLQSMGTSTTACCPFESSPFRVNWIVMVSWLPRQIRPELRRNSKID